MPKGTVWEGFWRLADPKISITSLACMTVGGAVAATRDALDWPWLGVLAFALFCMEVAKNAWGDVFDFDSGNDLAVAPEDRTNFSGGKRVLVDALLTRRETWAIAIVFAGLGIGLGALVVFVREPQVFWIGSAGLVLGWSYHGPPLRLAYRGLGELDVLVCYGPLLSVATCLMLTGEWSATTFWLSLPLGVFIAAFLWVNEFPDFLADRTAGKWNLVARLGRERASRVLPWIYAAGFALLAVLPTLTSLELPRTVWCGFVALPAAVWASALVWAEPLTFHRGRPAQPAALLAFVLYAAGVAVGLGPEMG